MCTSVRRGGWLTTDPEWWTSWLLSLVATTIARRRPADCNPPPPLLFVAEIKKSKKSQPFQKRYFCTFTFSGFLIVTCPNLVVAEIKKNFSVEIYPHYHQNQKDKVGKNKLKSISKVRNGKAFIAMPVIVYFLGNLGKLQDIFLSQKSIIWRRERYIQKNCFHNSHRS